MGELEIVKGDITDLAVDAIVNATNTALLSGSDAGVNGAIHRKGGPEIAEACKRLRIKLGEVKPGDAVITTAGNLKAKYVIHAVGPVWKEGENHEDNVLTDAYLSSMRVAEENGLKTVAFPNISTGIYQFPKEAAAKVAIDAIYTGLVRNIGIEKVIIVCYNDENYSIYTKLLAEI